MIPSILQNTYMLPYTGHGMIERHPRNMTVTGVVGHELRHKVSNQLKAASRGEVVRQQIHYKVEIVDGKFRAAGAVTEATFYKKVETERPREATGSFESDAEPDEGSVAAPALEGPMEYVEEDTDDKELEDELRGLKRRLERLEQKDLPAADPETGQAKALLEQEIRKINTRILMKKAAKELEKAQDAILGAVENDSGLAGQMMQISAHSQHKTSPYKSSPGAFPKGSMLDAVL